MRTARRPGSSTVVLVAVLLSVVWGLWRDAPGLGASATIRMIATEFRYEPKEVTSPPGDVSFVVQNAGAIEHNFVIEDQAQTRRAQIPIIEPGKTLVVQVTLQPGTYTIYCSEPGHREAGMVATLHVR